MKLFAQEMDLAEQPEDGIHALIYGPFSCSSPARTIHSLKITNLQLRPSPSTVTKHLD